MGSINRKRKLDLIDAEMPKTYVRRTQRYRRRRRYYPKTRISSRGPTKELNPTHTFTWLGNAGSLTVSGINNRHGALSLNLATLLPNCQGFLKIRELYTLFRIKKVLLTVQASNDENTQYNFTAAYQYNPVGNYPTVNDSDNQMEGANSKLKNFSSEVPAVFRCRFNALRQTFATLASTGYEVPQMTSFMTTGGTLSGSMSEIHCGRLVVASPGTNLQTVPASLRIRVEVTAQFAAPNWNA